MIDGVLIDMGLVLRQSTLLIGTGLVLGLAAAVGVTRSLQSILFGLTPLDPNTFITVSLMFALVATLAYMRGAARHTSIPWWHYAMNEA